MLESLELSSKDLVLVAINDCDTPDESGGAHWSLLAWYSRRAQFYHYDSLQGQNEKAARKTAHAIAATIGAVVPIKFKNIETVCQTNTYDCGMFLLAFAKNIGENYVKNKFENEFFLDSNNINVKELREELKKIILNLAKISNPVSSKNQFLFLKMASIFIKFTTNIQSYI